MIWCIRRPPWKLIKCFHPQVGDTHELFNLNDDPAEERNLFHGRAEVVVPLREKLNAWIAKGSP